MTDISAPRPWELFVKAMADAGTMRPAIKTRAEELCRLQAELIEQAAALSQGWFARRREGAHAAQSAALAMCDAADLVEAGRIYQRWLAGSFERLMADGAEAQTRVAGMVQAVLGAFPVTALAVEPAASAAAEAQERRAA